MNGGTGAVWQRRDGAHRVAQERGAGAVPISSAWPLASSLGLAALPTAVACGRLHTKLVLWEWQLDHLVDDAMILANELLTNAVRASPQSTGNGAGALVLLRLLSDHRQLLIEIWDQSPDDPEPRAVGHDAENGRGLLVIESLSRRWGWYRVREDLKVVWCEVAIERP